MSNYWNKSADANLPGLAPGPTEVEAPAEPSGMPSMQVSNGNQNFQQAMQGGGPVQGGTGFGPGGFGGGEPDRFKNHPLAKNRKRIGEQNLREKRMLEDQLGHEISMGDFSMRRSNNATRRRIKPHRL